MKENVFYRINNQLNEQDVIDSIKFIKSKNKGKLFFSPKDGKLFVYYITVIITAIIFTVVSAQNEFINIVKIPLIIFWCIVIAAGIYIFASNTRRFGKYNYKVMVRSEGESPINVEFIFTDRRIYSKGKTTKNSIEYNQIINVFDNDDRYYIQIYNANYFIIKKDCIVFGDRERLLEFIDKIKDKINAPDI